MKIGPLDHGNRPQRPDDEHHKGVAQDPRKQKQDRLNQTDSIQISPSGRHMAENPRSAAESSTARTDAPPPADLPPELSAYTDETEASSVRPEKVEQARKRVESGHYDKPEVKQEIARRITDDFQP